MGNDRRSGDSVAVRRAAPGLRSGLLDRVWRWSCALESRRRQVDDRGADAANLIVNALILGVFGTLTAMGEEIGWRGYLQPRLDAAGVRWSVAVVWLCQLAYHAPLIAGAGYVNAGSLPLSLVLFAAAD